ncbi:hypothetical protein [Halegenticoccus tardaugens]|uniref:hypothetical protein n=1 Tax=Halegenticoccus tardaugens TaxID=2071624 RepID=UPI00100C2ED4|nr:hypothetical protein [Halegenticoccus tardaugens]
MARSTSEDDPCPVCGQPYDRLVRVARGVGWNDLYPGSPFDYFEAYQRRCAADYDVEADEKLPARERAIYLHAGRRSVSVL